MITDCYNKFDALFHIIKTNIYDQLYVNTLQLLFDGLVYPREN